MSGCYVTFICNCVFIPKKCETELNALTVIKLNSGLTHNKNNEKVLN